MSYIKRKMHKIISYLIQKFDYQVKGIKHLELHNRSGTSTVINSPTGNCQMFTIKKFNHILNSSDKKFNRYIEQSLQFTHKKLLLLDINHYNLDKTKKRLDYCFDIISETHYESSNYSNMVILILKHNPYKINKKFKVIEGRIPGQSRHTYFFQHWAQ